MKPGALDIQTWIIDQLSRLTGLPAEQIDPRAPVRRLGLDSVTLVVFAAELEEWLSYRFTSSPFAEHATLEALSQFLAEQVARCP